MTRGVKVLVFLLLWLSAAGGREPGKSHVRPGPSRESPRGSASTPRTSIAAVSASTVDVATTGAAASSTGATTTSDVTALQHPAFHRASFPVCGPDGQHTPCDVSLPARAETAAAHACASNLTAKRDPATLGGGTVAAAASAASRVHVVSALA